MWGVEKRRVFLRQCLYCRETQELTAKMAEIVFAFGFRGLGVDFLGKALDRTSRGRVREGLTDSGTDGTGNAPGKGGRCVLHITASNSVSGEEWR